MTDTRQFKPSANVIYQTVDNETVIINLDNGRYYSLNAAGSFIWDCLMKQRTPDEIGQAFALPTDRDANAVTEDVTRFVNELAGEELVEPELRAAPPTKPLAQTELKFEAPMMEKFTDMEKLIPLDPIHQVGSMGWPFPQENSQ